MSATEEAFGEAVHEAAVTANLLAEDGHEDRAAALVVVVDLLATGCLLFGDWVDARADVLRAIDIATREEETA